MSGQIRFERLREDLPFGAGSFVKLALRVRDKLRERNARAQFEALQGLESAGTTPQQFADFARDERVKWARVVKQAGLKFD